MSRSYDQVERHSTVGKRAKRMPDATVETTRREITNMKKMLVFKYFINFQIFQDRLSNLSLNDWERIGKHFSATETLRF